MQSKEFKEVIFPMTTYPLPPDSKEKQAQYMKVIEAHYGKVILNESKEITGFQMVSSLLTDEICKQLDLDRVIVRYLQEAQLRYLQIRIPELVIELEKTQCDGYVLTFPAKNKLFLLQAIQKWDKLNHSATTLAAWYKGYRIRHHFFKQAEAHLDEISQLQYEIASENLARNFSKVSQLAEEAAFLNETYEKEMCVIKRKSMIIKPVRRKLRG